VVTQMVKLKDFAWHRADVSLHLCFRVLLCKVTPYWLWLIFLGVVLWILPLVQYLLGSPVLVAYEFKWVNSENFALYFFYTYYFGRCHLICPFSCLCHNWRCSLSWVLVVRSISDCSLREIKKSWYVWVMLFMLVVQQTIQHAGTSLIYLWTGCLRDWMRWWSPSAFCILWRWGLCLSLLAAIFLPGSTAP
jgi:hypothetical protein